MRTPRSSRIRVEPSSVAASAPDVVTEAAGGDPGDLGEVLVAAVAGRGQHAEAPAADVEALHQPAHRLDRRRVVAVVEDDLEGMLVEYVHPAGCLEEAGIE